MNRMYHSNGIANPNGCRRARNYQHKSSLEKTITFQIACLCVRIIYDSIYRPQPYRRAEVRIYKCKQLSRDNKIIGRNYSTQRASARGTPNYRLFAPRPGSARNDFHRARPHSADSEPPRRASLFDVICDLCCRQGRHNSFL